MKRHIIDSVLPPSYSPRSARRMTTPQPFNVRPNSHLHKQSLEVSNRPIDIVKPNPPRTTSGLGTWQRISPQPDRQAAIPTEQRYNTPLKAKRSAKQRSRGDHFKLPLKLGAVIGLMVGFALFVQTLGFGELAIAIYAVYAFIRKVSSQTTYILALVLLLGFATLQQAAASSIESSVSSNFLTYSLLLLVTGTISLGLEVRNGKS